MVARPSPHPTAPSRELTELVRTLADGIARTGIDIAPHRRPVPSEVDLLRAEVRELRVELDKNLYPSPEPRTGVDPMAVFAFTGIVLTLFAMALL